MTPQIGIYPTETVGTPVQTATPAIFVIAANAYSAAGGNTHVPSGFFTSVPVSNAILGIGASLTLASAPGANLFLWLFALSISCVTAGRIDIQDGGTTFYSYLAVAGQPYNVALPPQGYMGHGNQALTILNSTGALLNIIASPLLYSWAT